MVLCIVFEYVYYNTVICDFGIKTIYMGIYAGFSSKEKNIIIIEQNSKKQEYIIQVTS